MNGQRSFTNGAFQGAIDRTRRLWLITAAGPWPSSKTALQRGCPALIRWLAIRKLYSGRGESILVQHP